jgi:carbonic anhydrase
MAQARILSRLPIIVRAWERRQQLAIHGWIYDLRDGLLRDLEVGIDASAP